MMPNMAIILALTATVHCLDTASYASRIAGVRTGRPAMASALFNIVSLASRVAYTLQAPLIASAVDRAVAQGTGPELLPQFRLIIFAATGGTILGALLIPTFSAIFGRATLAYDVHRSFLTLVLHAMTPRGFSRIAQEVRLPLPESVRQARQSGFPRSFLLLNAAVVAIYTVGILATSYASTLVPELARTTTSLSGVVNGVGTLLLVLLVDPVSALITDQALRGARPQAAVSHVVIWQVVGRIAGTLTGQAIFLPAAWLVAFLARTIQ